MATLRRGLVDKVKKAAAKVSTRGVQAATKAGTRGARALVETTMAAVKTVDKLQEKLGRRSSKARITEEPKMGERMFAGNALNPSRTSTKPARAVTKPTGAATKSAPTATKPRRASAGMTDAARPMAMREAGRKTMPAAAPKRSKAVPAPRKQFKVKRGQKHPHTGR